MKTKVPRPVPNGAESGLSFPHVINRRQGTATIYRYERVKSGRSYAEFKIAVFDSDGKRSFRSFSSFEEARKAAEARLDALGRGLVDVTTLQGPARLDYLAATKLLPVGRSLTESVRALLREQAGSTTTPIRAPDLVTAFIAAKENRTRSGRAASDVYLRDIRWRLAQFAKTFSMEISDISPNQLENWLAEIAPGPVNAWNMVRLLRTVYRWAQKRGHLPPGPLPTDSLDIHKPVSTEAPAILTPEQLAKLLSVATASLIPYLAVAAFAGLRQAEIQRLDWKEVSFERGFVEVTAEKSKVASRRLVPMGSALRAWLEPHRQPKGPLCDLSNVAKPLLKAAARAGINWQRNALRHSWVSYRMAILQDAAKTALEAGNSPAMIFAHYRELVTPAQAQEWFSVSPPKSAGETKSQKISAPTSGDRRKGTRQRSRETNLDAVG